MSVNADLFEGMVTDVVNELRKQFPLSDIIGITTLQHNDLWAITNKGAYMPIMDRSIIQRGLENWSGEEKKDA